MGGIVDAVAPAPAPERPQTPPRPASPVAPPRPPSPVGIGARLPRRTRNKPREWWKLSAAQLDECDPIAISREGGIRDLMDIRVDKLQGTCGSPFRRREGVGMHLAS